MTRKNLQIGLLGCLLLLACRQKMVHPARDQCTTESEVTRDTSFFNVPIIIPTRLIQDKINAAVKTNLIHDDNFENISRCTGRKDHLKLDANRTGDIELKWTNNRATCRVPIMLLLERAIAGGKRSANPLSIKTTLELVVVFDITVDIAPDWNLLTSTKFRSFEWGTDTKAMGGLVSLKKPVQRCLLQDMKFIESSIDSQINQQVHLDRVIQRIWGNLQRPIALNKDHRVAWLQIQPLRFDIGKIQTVGDNLVIQSRITTFTQTLIGETPLYSINSNLPPAQRIEFESENIFIHLLSEIPYQSIRSVILAKIRNQTFPVQGHKITIRDVEIWGCGDDLVLQLKVRGDLRGELFMRGKPVYQRDSQLVIQQFDFELNTEETLVGAADWLLHSEFREQTESMLALPLKERIAQMPYKIEENIESSKLGERIDLNIHAWQFTPEKIVMGKDHLTVVVTIQGKIDIVLEKI